VARKDVRLVKRFFAKDRWQVVRITQYYKDGIYDDGIGAVYCKLMLRNKYSGKPKTVKLDGHWEWEDFPDGVYR
jgi:hypothetical protein